MQFNKSAIQHRISHKTLLPLQSHRHAEFLHNEVPGIEIPLEAREAMREAGEKGIEVGIEMCRSLLLQARGLVEGVYLMPSFGRYEVVARVAEVIQTAPGAIQTAPGAPSPA